MLLSSCKNWLPSHMAHILPGHPVVALQSRNSIKVPLHPKPRVALKHSLVRFCCGTSVIGSALQVAEHWPYSDHGPKIPGS